MIPKRKVFVSYARSDKTSAEVGELVRWLKGQEGVEVISDHLYPYKAPLQGWHVWMQQSIEDADIVLCICGKKFKDGFEKKGGSPGVTFEGAIVNAELHKKRRLTNKFCPILPEAGAYECVPTSLQEWENNIVLTQREKILSLIREELTDEQVSNARPFEHSVGSASSSLPSSPPAPPVKEDLPCVREQDANALFDKGQALAKLGMTAEASALYETAIALYVDIGLHVCKEASPGACEIELAARVLSNKGHALQAQGKTEAAIAVYDEVDRRFGAYALPGVREQVIGARLQKSLALDELGKTEKAINVCEEVGRLLSGGSPMERAGAEVAREYQQDFAAKMGRIPEKPTDKPPSPSGFSASPKPDNKRRLKNILILVSVLGICAAALAVSAPHFGVGKSNMARELYESGKRAGGAEEAIKIYDEVVRRFGDDGRHWVQKWAVEALLEKGEIWRRGGQLEEAIAVYDEVARRFGKGEQHQRSVAEALLRKGHALKAQGKTEEAIAVYGELDRRFGYGELTSPPANREAR